MWPCYFRVKDILFILIMKNFTRHQHIEPFKLVAVDAALERIDPNCYVGLYSEIICKEIERALYDQLSDEQNTLRGAVRQTSPSIRIHSTPISMRSLKNATR